MRGRGGAWQGVCMAGGVHGGGGSCMTGGHVWGACMVGGMCGKRGCVWQGGMSGGGHACHSSIIQ